VPIEKEAVLMGVTVGAVEDTAAAELAVALVAAAGEGVTAAPAAGPGLAATAIACSSCSGNETMRFRTFFVMASSVAVFILLASKAFTIELLLEHLRT
jgi:hypothetical protein